MSTCPSGKWVKLARHPFAGYNLSEGWDRMTPNYEEAGQLTGFFYY
jgi:hypothetical protein